jgi:hypothetical protein
VSTVERLRWRIVTVVDKIPGQCWSDLADWAGRWFSDPDDPDESYGPPWRPQTWVCRTDAERVGACYCGKLQAEPWAAAVHASHQVEGRWGDGAAEYEVLCTCGWHGADYRSHFAGQLDAAREIAGVSS